MSILLRLSDVNNFLDKIFFLSFYFHDTSECHIGLKLLQFNCHFMGKTAVTMLQCNTARLNLERGQHLKKRGVYF